MLGKNKIIDDFLDKGFRLSYFIYPSRPVAIEILRKAMTKLKAQRSRETRRTYWRDKHLKNKITRTVRNEQDMLQWLIYREAECYERQQELAGDQSVGDMLVRYIKHLVQLTTAMSSFYANVGLQRLLYSYNTPETQRLYETVSDHYPGAEEYRRVKGVLMKQLSTRFHFMLKTCKTNHGEMRFEATNDQERWVDLVDQCLSIFTPWSTCRTCSNVAVFNSDIRAFCKTVFGNEHQGTQKDDIEANRAHIFIEPICHGWISERLGLSAPRERLSVPRFYLASRKDDFPNEERFLGKNSQLSEYERRQLLDSVAQETRPRQQKANTLYSILIDGTEYATINADAKANYSWEIPEGVKLLEVWTQSDEPRLLVGTHWIEYTESQGIAEATATISVSKTKEMLLQLKPIRAPFEMAGGASILLHCQPASRIAKSMEALKLSVSSFRLREISIAFVCTVALIGVFATVKYGLESARQRTRAEALGRQLAAEEKQRASLEQRLGALPNIVAPVVYRLSPEEFRVRSGESRKVPVVSLPAGAELVSLELPVNSPRGSYRATLKSFVENQEVLSESSLQPQLINGVMTVTFVLPASLLDNQKHYVIDLYETDKAGKFEGTRMFAFYFVRQQPVLP